MDRYPVQQDNSQLLREAKIGFSIVLLVVSTVGYWGYCTYHKFRTQIPDHVASAPLAQMIGPDEYLRSLERRSARVEERIAARREVGTSSPASQLTDPFSDVGARQVGFDQPLGQQEAQQTRAASSFQPIQQNFVASRSQPPRTVNHTINELSSTQSTKIPKSDLETSASSLLSKMNDAMERVKALNPIGEESNAIRSKKNESSHAPKGDRPDPRGPIVPLDRPEPNRPEPKFSKDDQSFVPIAPMPVSKVSSDDNANTGNVAKDLSQQFVQAKPAQPVVPAPSPLVTSRPSLKESDKFESHVDHAPLVGNTTAMRTFEQSAKTETSNQSTAEAGGQRKKPLEIDELDAEDIVVEIESPQVAVDETLTGEAGNGNGIVSDSTYIAQTGDSWWSIATDFYDDGRYFRALYQHNQKLAQVSEQLSAGTRVVTPELQILHENYRQYCPVDKLSAETQKLDSYTTVQGDTLFGIARKVTGQASKYLEIYQLNRERLPARMSHLTRLPADIELTLPR